MAVTPYRFFTTVTPLAGSTNPWTDLNNCLSDTATSATNDANLVPDNFILSGHDLSADVPVDATIDRLDIRLWCRCLDFGGVTSAANILHRFQGSSPTTLVFAMPKQTFVYLNMDRTVDNWGLSQAEAREVVDGTMDLRMAGITRVDIATDRYYLNEYSLRVHYTPAPETNKARLPGLF